jgi:hypothetical protein
MTKKQKALAQTIFTVILIATVNQFIEARKFPTVYTSRYAPEDTAIERKDMGNTGRVEKIEAGEDSVKAESSPEHTPEQLIKEVFGDKADIAIAIAKAESGLNPEAVGDLHITFEKDGKLMGMSCGLFQVRILEGRPDCETLKDPETNVRYAKALYDKSGFQPWSAYTSGKYLENL